MTYDNIKSHKKPGSLEDTFFAKTTAGRQIDSPPNPPSRTPAILGLKMMADSIGFENVGVE